MLNILEYKFQTIKIRFFFLHFLGKEYRTLVTSSPEVLILRKFWSHLVPPEKSSLRHIYSPTSCGWLGSNDRGSKKFFFLFWIFCLNSFDLSATFRPLKHKYQSFFAFPWRWVIKYLHTPNNQIKFTHLGSLDSQSHI